jgi:hypothetical protein
MQTVWSYFSADQEEDGGRGRSPRSIGGLGAPAPGRSRVWAAGSSCRGGRELAHGWQGARAGASAGELVQGYEARKGRSPWSMGDLGEVGGELLRGALAPCQGGRSWSRSRAGITTTAGAGSPATAGARSRRAAAAVRAGSHERRRSQEVDRGSPEDVIASAASAGADPAGSPSRALIARVADPAGSPARALIARCGISDLD